MELAVMALGVLGAASLGAVRILGRRAFDSPRPRGQEVHVRIRGGYIPDTIVARAGRPVRVVFHREESAACSEHVVFPELGKSAMLPVGEDVAVDLLPESPGEYEFTCQMGMLRGRLIVLADGTSGEREHVAAGTGWVAPGDAG